MAIEVKVPTLGESISSGIIAKWHVQDGATVKQGQALFDLETDKITSEGTAEADGVITLKVAEGDEVEVGALLALIDTAASPGRPTSVSAAKPPAAAPVTHPPSVRRIAAESGIDPATVTGSGKGGRVTKADMQAAVEQQAAPGGTAAVPSATDPTARVPPIASGKDPTTRVPPAAAPSTAQGRETRRKLTPLRRTIARRLVEAQQTTAMLTTFNECDMSAILDLRRRHQDAFTARHGIKLGFMSFFTKAAVHALQAVPAINARLDNDELVQNRYYDIGIAISGPRGLLVPVIRDCDQLDLAGIEKELQRHANNAKDGKTAIEDLQGGVFTISNGGVFGSLLSTPILNYPQAAILGMHATQERPVARAGQVVIRPMMYLALSYDHRIVDGREAVTFLVKLREAIEDPVRLVLGI
jgi:2-oxoglutarate dehydrogenase E2 component (dihydrolipoamide succinyltransferase)